MATQKEVFAFEGLGGFPLWFKPGSDYSPTDKGFLNWTLSSPQVLNYWRAAAIAGATPGTVTPANPNGDVAWHYYSQDDVTAAEAQIEKIATVNHGTPAAPAYDTITILGYSNGGAAALEVADWLNTKSKQNPQPITVDLAITCDPVPRPVPADFLPFAKSSWSLGGPMPTAAPKNVTNWYNFYQNFDTDSIAAANLLNVPGGLPRRIWGRTVTGATTNTEVIMPPPNNVPVCQIKSSRRLHQLKLTFGCPPSRS